MTMPPALLNAYSSEYPRLVAEESLIWAERIAVGTGSLRKGVGSRITSGWAKAADHKRPVIRPRSAKEYEAHMASLGIGVRREKVTSDG